MVTNHVNRASRIFVMAGDEVDVIADISKILAGTGINAETMTPRVQPDTRPLPLLQFSTPPMPRHWLSKS